MKLTGKIFAATLIIICTSAFGFAQEKNAQSGNQDEAAIRQIVKSVEAGWNALDGKVFAAPFSSDADYVVVNGMHIKGRDAIEKGHTGIFTTVYKESRNAATVKIIRFLRPDVAVAHVEWNLEYKAGGETKKARAMNTMIFTKDNGKWSIAAFHNTPILPPAGN
ncbi:MAG: SgcJ/EcaC family oxidoreductase [Acidobacteriota bacterium]|nr:SgcJ/EcaC family oxidoreductase [Acidobacteriota bacterium]